LREQYLQQVKAATQLKAQRDALVTERRTLQETLQTLREQPTQQVNANIGQPPIPLPVGRNSMTEEEKLLFDEKLVGAIKAGGIEALETLLKNQVAGRSPQFGAFCQLRAANIALANGHVADASRMAGVALRNDSQVATVQGAAHVYQDAALLEKANQLVD